MCVVQFCSVWSVQCTVLFSVHFILYICLCVDDCDMCCRQGSSLCRVQFIAVVSMLLQSSMFCCKLYFCFIFAFFFV